MFRIGDFSRVARVSCRLLRYYDELGLLKPMRVEAGTGYRYYSAAQLPRLNRILVLKDLGLSLEQIRPIVDGDVSAGELRGRLLMRRAHRAHQVVAPSSGNCISTIASFMRSSAGRLRNTSRPGWPSR